MCAKHKKANMNQAQQVQVLCYDPIVTPDQVEASIEERSGKYFGMFAVFPDFSALFIDDDNVEWDAYDHFSVMLFHIWDPRRA